MPFTNKDFASSLSQTLPLLVMLLILHGTASGQDDHKVEDNNAATKIEKAGTVIVRGKIKNASGKARPDAKIEIFLVPQYCDCRRKPSCRRDCRSCCPRARVISATIGVSGKFEARFENVEPDKYVLTNLLDEYPAGYEEVIEVNRGETEKINLGPIVDYSTLPKKFDNLGKQP